MFEICCGEDRLQTTVPFVIPGMEAVEEEPAEYERMDSNVPPVVPNEMSGPVDLPES